MNVFYLNKNKNNFTLYSKFFWKMAILERNLSEIVELFLIEFSVQNCTETG